ncbi:hypothetical protein KDJ02_gp02 [Arthrobacter phage Litotes]|uniref:Minor tail protein n=1 Tax=Arthrobacter phage Litotes TaxID=2499008 RepID=A0A3S9UEI7_9CAUD|nr:hypothetical protein KDJ02_gp02 [Arthrobacter phage Litotes]AZS08723.1 hypothetical protein SEA_LITOTES_2 [Arthrobacter phage Litotes]
MARTPDDPTKAQVWIDNTDPLNPLFEFYFPRGSKGDPGGIVNPANIGAGYDWNNLIVSGMYYATGSDLAGQPNSPPAMAIGVNIMVQARNASVVTQVAWTVSNAQSQIQFMRSLVSGTWGPWRVVRNTNVDNTVGKVISIWDETQNRSQIIYGDTGDRDISTTYGNGTFAVLKVRRVGSWVELVCLGWVPPANSTANALLSSLPVGYRNYNSRAFAAVDNNTTLRPATLSANTSGLSIPGNTTASSISFSLTYQTLDTWPTVLPGTAVGSIPNL